MWVETQPTVELYRGANSSALEYWAVEDTFLDSAKPDANFGRDALLSGGPQKTVLIKFGDLSRVLSGNRVVDAKLVLTVSSGQNPTVSQVAEMLVPWGEGPSRRGMALPNPLDPKNPNAKPKDEAPQWSATWKQRRGGRGGIAWQLGGATGDQDSRVLSSIQGAVEGEHFVISGLGTSLQRMLERPFANHGWSLEFASPIELTSSESLKNGPRLLVTWEPEPGSQRPDLAVISIRSSKSDLHSWPRDGEEITWTATVRNVGKMPSQSFQGTWFVRERAAGLVESPTGLAPGESKDFTIRLPFNSQKEDHRTETIALITTQQVPDADLSNDGLKVYTNALPIVVSLASAQNGESAAQSWLDFWNDVVLPQNRYGAAPEGVLERYRIQEFVSTDSDQVWKFQPTATQAEHVRSLGALGGLFDFSSMTRLPGTVTVEGAQIAPGWADFAPGLFGGDARDDSLYPKLLPIPETQWSSPMAVALPTPMNSYLSRTDVGFLNAAVGDLGPARSAKWAALPQLCLVRAFDATGKPLGNTTLTFYQVHQGEPNAVPAFTTKTAAQGGAANLENRPTSIAGAASPYGVLEAGGKNGLFLVKAEARNTVSWAWLPIWRFIDEYRRGNTGAAMVDLRFNIPSGPLNLDQDLALNKIVTDSAGSLPAQLAALVDGNAGTECVFAPARSTWIEIDLGRDRPLGEVVIDLPTDTTRAQIWPQFEVFAYGTGQKPNEARLYAKEINGPAALLWRRIVSQDAPGLISLAYRGAPERARYVRILAPGGPAAGAVRIRSIRVHTATPD